MLGFFDEWVYDEGRELGGAFGEGCRIWEGFWGVFWKVGVILSSGFYVC